MDEATSSFEQQQNHSNQVLKQPILIIDDSESDTDDTKISSNFFSTDLFTKVQPKKFNNLKEVLPRVNNGKIESVDNGSVEFCHVSLKKSNNFSEHQEEICIVTKLADNILKTSNESRVVDCSVNSLLAFESKILKRKRLTAEERQATKELKAKEKIENLKKKEELKIQKELEKERLRASKKVNSLNNRCERKEEAVQRMLVVIGSQILQEPNGAEVLKSLQAVGARYEIKELPLPSIAWLRESFNYGITDITEITKTCSYKEEEHVIFKMSAKQLADSIKAKDCDKENLKNTINCVKDIFPGKKICAVIIGMNAYYQLAKTKENKLSKNKQVNEGPVKKRQKNVATTSFVSKDLVETALVKQQLISDVNFRFTEHMSDFSEFVSSYTKALANAPYKNNLRNADSFLRFSNNSDKTCVKVSNNGQGVLQLWNQQLQQFYGVRHDTSVAITQAFPTPWLLMTAYKKLSPEVGMKLLADVEVRRGTGVLQTSRKIGPELSKKLHRLFTSVDGDEPLSK